MTPISSKQLMQEFVFEQEERHRNPDKYRGWQTGIADLDKVTGGLHRGWYLVVAGSRKSGKTAMLTTMRTWLGRQKVQFLSVSLEESNLQLAERQVSNVAHVDRSLFRDISLKPADWKKVDDGAREISKYSGWWDYGISSVDDIYDVAVSIGAEVIFVDYIQLLSEPGNSNRVQEIGNISRKLKALTLKTPPMTVVAAAQLNDEGQYLWSRDLGRDADVAIKLTRLLDPYGAVLQNELKCEIADTRHSEMADFKLLFNGAQSFVASLVDINTLMEQKLNVPAGK